VQPGRRLPSGPRLALVSMWDSTKRVLREEGELMEQVRERKALRPCDGRRANSEPVERETPDQRAFVPQGLRVSRMEPGVQWRGAE
jgi:hypothetical protein